MSYWFRMGFKEIEEKDLLDYCINITKECLDNSKEILEDNKYYIPSYRRFNLFSEQDNTEEMREMDRHWLYNLFSVDFIYWKELNLLGIVGNLPKSVKLQFFEFQNSCDQDYEYEYWGDISYFQNIINEIKDSDSKKITQIMNEKYKFSDYKESEISKDIDYYKRSAVYVKIYNNLDLEKWLYGKYGKFKRFSMQAITSTEKSYTISKELEFIKKNLIKELYEEE